MVGNFAINHAMQEPSLRKSRLAIAGGLAATIFVGGAGFYLGRTTAPDAAMPGPEATALPAPQPSATVEPIQVLGRADIVALAATAGEALAANAAPPREVTAAVGRRFELAVPFGCGGPASQDSQVPLRWRYDEAEETLRLHVSSTSWLATDWRLDATSGVEAIEGFWVARPWSSAGTCPQPAGPEVAAGMEPVTIPGQTLAVAQFFTGTTRREALRDGRPFESVQRVPRDEFDASRGFRLMLTGRIERVPGGGPVRCIQPAGIEQRPICVVAITLDEVRIENPVGDAVLASWTVGGG